MSDTVQVGNYVRRVVDSDLDEVFAQLPAILLDGPKGVGKTATALQRCATVRRLDVGREREIVAADPDIVATDPPTGVDRRMAQRPWRVGRRPSNR